MTKGTSPRKPPRKSITKSNSKSEDRKINFWYFLKWLLEKSFEKGIFWWVFPTICFFGYIFLLPPEHRIEIWHDFRTFIIGNYLWGYASGFVILVTWYLQHRRMTKFYKGEIKRMADQKNDVEQKLLDLESKEIPLDLNDEKKKSIKLPSSDQTKKQ